MVKLTYSVRTSARFFSKLYGKQSQIVKHETEPQYKVEGDPPPLSEPLPGLPSPVYITAEEVDHSLKMTVLQNGMRVATLPYLGNYSTVGVIVDAGAKHTGNYVGGLTHILEKLAFNRTLEYSSKDKMIRDLERYGGICDCQVDRDFIMYAVSAENKAVDPVVRILSESVLRPKITDNELQAAFNAVRFDIDTLHSKPEQDQNMTELIHSAAYNDKTYGLPTILTPANLRRITKEVIYTYFDNYFTPSRMVLCGVGVDHSNTVKAAEKFFQDSQPIWEIERNLVLEDDKFRVQKLTPEYVGGASWEFCEIPTHANTDLPQLAHVVIALNAFPYGDPDFISLCVLNLMMGGGNSFSAGGPGKGMFSRLYLNALNRYPWMFSCAAFNSSYTGGGLFGIHASSPPEYFTKMVTIVIRELCSVAVDDIRQPLQRAKAQLRSLYLMNLEMRPMVFEDVSRQVIALGTWQDRDYFISEMEKVTAADVQRVAKRLLSSRLSVAARGDLSGMPPYLEIHNYFEKCLNQ